MKLEFPYQLVAFLDNQPAIGEAVYSGEKGWYPQLALKRRFKVIELNENDLKDRIRQFCANIPSITIHTGELMKPERMPVHVIEVTDKEELMTFHLGFIDYMGDQMVSRYPERDGENYLPHITAEYDGNMVIDTAAFANKTFVINKICLIKDIDDEDSQAYEYFDLDKN